MPSRKTKKDEAPQRSKRTRKPTRKTAAPKGKPRPQDHPNYQDDLPSGFLQNTNPQQDRTY